MIIIDFFIKIMFYISYKTNHKEFVLKPFKIVFIQICNNIHRINFYYEIDELYYHEYLKSNIRYTDYTKEFLKIIKIPTRSILRLYNCKLKYIEFPNKKIKKLNFFMNQCKYLKYLNLYNHNINSNISIRYNKSLKYININSITNDLFNNSYITNPCLCKNIIVFKLSYNFFHSRTYKHIPMLKTHTI